MASRSTRYKDFGTWLREIRIRAGFPSQSNVAVRGRSGLVNQGKLSHIERGLNANPAPALLRELAVLYKRPYAELVARWVHVRFGVDLLETKFTIEDFLSGDEGRCLERYRNLSPGDRDWLLDTLDRLQKHAPTKGRLVGTLAWDGIERRSGRDRRKAS